MALNYCVVNLMNVIKVPSFDDSHVDLTLVLPVSTCIFTRVFFDTCEVGVFHEKRLGIEDLESYPNNHSLVKISLTTTTGINT